MPSIALAELARRFWAFRCDESPLTAIQASVATDATQLLREAPADHERRAAWARDALTELATIDAASLTVADRTTRALLHRELAALVETVERRAHLRPSLYPLGPHFALVQWAGQTVLATPDDVASYLARLAGIRASLDSVTAALAHGVDVGIAYPRLVVERAVAQLAAQLSVPVEASSFYAPLARIAGRSAATAAQAERGRTLIAEGVYGALEAYRDHLESVLLPRARETIGCAADLDGAEFYRHTIVQFATVSLTPDAIHAIGTAEVERITAEMHVVADAAGFAGDLPGFRRSLLADSRQFAGSGEQLREQIEVLSKRIDARIPEFFGRTPRTTYGVSSIPAEIAESMPPAYAQPNPVGGGAAGIHWITSIPAKCPRYMHLPLALHEAWPGHLMHLALIQEMEHLPDFQRYGASGYSACLEGWALYCEALGEDMGFYDTPEKRYGRLEMEMWRAVRLVLDTGIHAMGWGRDRSIAYFGAHMAMPLDAITAEVDRYIGLPGQALAYQLGNLTFRDLRRRAEAALGDDFGIRDFHDALIAAGPATLPVLETIVDDWIAARSPPA